MANKPKKQYRVKKITITQLVSPRSASPAWYVVIVWAPTRHNVIGDEYEVKYVAGDYDHAVRLAAFYRSK